MYLFICFVFVVNGASPSTAEMFEVVGRFLKSLGLLSQVIKELAQ